MVRMRHVFNCAPISSNTETNITKPKLVINCCVNTVVCVRNPGPMEELAIKKAAPKIAEFRLKNLNDVYCFFLAMLCSKNHSLQLQGYENNSRNYNLIIEVFQICSYTLNSAFTT